MCLCPFQFGAFLAVCSLARALCRGLCGEPWTSTHMSWVCVEPQGLLRLPKPAQAPECYKGTWKPWCEWRQGRTSSSSSKLWVFRISYLLVKRRKSGESWQPSSREQHSHSRMVGSCAHLSLYWLCSPWSSSRARLSCAKTPPTLHQQWPCVCRSDLPLLPYTATFLLWQREQKAKHRVLLCSVCRTKMLWVTPPLGRIHHMTVTLIFWLKISFPSGSFCVNWSACSNYVELILHQPWKSTSLTSQPGLRCLSNWGWLFSIAAF